MAAASSVPGWRRALRGAALPAAGLLLWWAAVQGQWSDSPLLVSPARVAATAVQELRSGELLAALGASLRRDLLGLAIGVTVGALLGGLLGVSRLAERLVGPSFHTVKQISLFAWLPLLSLWFGLGDAAKVAFIALAAFFPMALNTFDGFRATPPELVEVARVLRYSRAQLLARVVLPAAAPALFTGLHLALIYAWLATLGAEYVMVSGQGIGNLLIDGREHFWMDKVLLGVFVVGLVGWALNAAGARIEGRTLAWRGRSTGFH